MEDYQDHVTITTPEGVALRLVLAGPATRILAGVLDLLVRAVVLGGLALVGYLALGDAAAETAGEILLPIAVFAMLFLWDIGWEVAGNGATPGKRLMGARVVCDDGHRVDLGSSAVRNLLRLVEWPLAYIPGIVLVIATARHQRIGDLVGGTLVVREGRRRAARTVPPTDGVAATARPRSVPRDGGVKVGAPTVAGQAVWAAPGPPPGTAVASPLVDRPQGAGLDTSALTDHDRSTVRRFVAWSGTLDSTVRRDLARTIATALRGRVSGIPPQTDDEALVLLVGLDLSRQ